ncbi:SusE domain-containing protein [Leeuwenhoekiella parthenopeia]|uniref:SusE domain-containing protein n=1 Tax=Leeuwenhoekiella parthenopeia TaxID=2890320 RepID=A0ABS8GT21_9FLAO|nr:SusE domain-containing protein [Leeuwenhoekiella parthenopeia]MCC4212281.1 SusE domain-containing protein [Leeuwenhoekiella parthenopeia]
MKTVLKYSFLIAFAATTFMACDNTEDLVLTKPESTFEINATNFANLVLNPSFPENPAVTISWNTAENAGATYEVVMATDAEFSNSVSLGTTDQSNFTISVSQLNQMLLDAGLEPYKPSPVYVRINNGGETTSSLTYNITPYAVEAPVVTNPEADAVVVLDGENPDAQALSVTWTDFSREGTEVSVVYELQMAAAGSNFETPVSVGRVTNGGEYNLSNVQLNNLALSLGAEEAADFDLEMRIVGTITTDTGENVRTSEVVPFTVTTYESFTDLFLVGAATAPGWDNNNNNPAIVRLPDNKDAYRFTGKFNGDAFKLLEVRGQWQPQWGLNNGNFASSEALGFDPDVLSVSTTGYYTLDVNTKTGTYSITPYDAGGATTYGAMGLIGSGRTGDDTGWGGDDIDFTQSTFDPHLWYLNNITLFDGQVKIRANNAWDVSWGANTAVSGFATSNNGPNIPVSAGTYDIWFSDLTGGYIFIPRN